MTHQAIRIAERFLRQRLIVRDFTQALKQAPRWQRLDERPVQLIGGDLAISVEIDLNGIGWVLTSYGDCLVSYKAGMVYTADQLPEPICEALRRLDAWLDAGGNPTAEPPEAVIALLRPYQRQEKSDGVAQAIP